MHNYCLCIYIYIYKGAEGWEEEGFTYKGKELDLAALFNELDPALCV